MIDFLDKYINPIHLLGLRSYVRTKRFSYIFNLSLLLMVGAMLFAIFSMTLTNISSAEIGKNLFVTFSVIQYITIGLVFPAFSCTAIIAEKQEKTYDLLITANLTESQIVWGKFLSGFTHSAIFLISSLPIVTIAFLFGGITPTLISITYLVSFAYSAFVIMSCLAISTLYKSITRSIIASYILIIVVNIFIGVPFFALLFDYLYYTELQKFFRTIGGYTSLSGILTLYIVPVFIFLATIFFPYLIAKNSLKLNISNRSTSLRVYFLCMGTTAFLIFFAYILDVLNFYNQSKIASDELIILTGFVYGIIGLLCCSAAIGFCNEDPVPKKFVTKRLHDYLNRNKFLKVFSFKPIFSLFLPGSINGMAFVMCTCLFWLLSYIIATTIVMNYWDLTNQYFGSRYLASYYIILFRPAMVIFSFVFFISSLGTSLSFYVKNKGWRRTLLFTFILMTMIFIPLFVIFSMDSRSFFQATPYNLQYFSPSLCFFFSLLPTENLVDKYFDFIIYGIPIYYIHNIIYLFTGIVLSFFNMASLKKNKKKLLEEENAILNLKNSK